MGPRGAHLLAVVLILGLYALVEAQKPSPCRCSRLAIYNREDCGFPGITSDQCYDMGCCFNSSVAGVPWCFHPLPNQASEQCVMEVTARKNCAYPHIMPDECTSRRNCCFSEAFPSLPWCYFPKSVEGKNGCRLSLLRGTTAEPQAPGSCKPEEENLNQTPPTSGFSWTVMPHRGS
ncbi:trefoil factor 2-like [Meriones unguiculatus]|uniref:trefoil factor 2-like n=1 Tax=Meriones unguiculatus TaxID=10047 RepID=UPI00293E2B57|nr:trefoil factor 2-like [Meriones unguiculatus]